MSFLAKYNKQVLLGVVGFFLLLLINHLIFTFREGLEPAQESEQQKSSEETINSLRSEVAKLTSELSVLERVASLNQSKVASLKTAIQTKQTEIDNIQNKLDVEKLNAPS